MKKMSVEDMLRGGQPKVECDEEKEGWKESSTNPKEILPTDKNKIKRDEKFRKDSLELFKQWANKYGESVVILSISEATGIQEGVIRNFFDSTIKKYEPYTNIPERIFNCLRTSTDDHFKNINTPLRFVKIHTPPK